MTVTRPQRGKMAPPVCPNPKCLAPGYTCGDGCTCDVSNDVTCDPCAELKASKAIAAAAGGSGSDPKLTPAERTLTGATLWSRVTTSLSPDTADAVLDARPRARLA